MVTLQINGNEHRLDIPEDMPLLWVLRDVIGLTGTKFGCGIAQCGACTVHIDGRPIRSCVIPAPRWPIGPSRTLRRSARRPSPPGGVREATPRAGLRCF